MSLLDLYKEMSQTTDVLKKYSETGRTKLGKIFIFQNTNYRYINSFLTNYKTFSEIEGVNRSEWELNKGHGQEKLKQHTVNMLKSKFFSKNVNKYYKTKKGKTLESIPEDFNESEKWFLIYYLLLDSYFDNIPNYILKQTNETFENFLVHLHDESKIIKNIEVFLKNKNKGELFEFDYIYMDTFRKPFQNYDFLAKYINSTAKEKKELQEYISSEYKFVKENHRQIKRMNYQFKCIISKKYQPSGVYDKRMLIDNARLLYLSNYINSSSFRNWYTFTKKTLDYFSKVEKINEEKLLSFINKHKDVFELIYLNALNPDYLDTSIDVSTITETEENEIITKARETSIIESVDEIIRVSSVLKRKALERARYKCELEDLYNCQTHYFTNRSTGKTYVELHHFIPREFSNDFEKSIEEIENYVSLCPRCHRFLHSAADRERISAINYLFKQKETGLSIKGISVDLKTLKSYYKINVK